MSDEDMKIYVPSTGAERAPLPETDEVKVYTCSSEPSASAEQSAQTP